MAIMIAKKEDYYISTDKSKLDISVIHDFLANESYWAQKIPRSVVEKSVEGSMCFGIYHQDQQVGFARVITDCAVFAYLADVFVINSHRGKGLSKFLLETILSHPDLQGLRKWLLGTADAHKLYRKFGFTEIPNPERFMHIANANPYT
ncbi:GNAT family N-acetyltransferase [Chitinophaga sp. MM2321]|uniref:GNAT family N-acetyltransferase n=1 Tax=Chitinophaga sp. MM2321 TaxID=3137178 RepID=UPI0032D56E1C